MDITTTTSMTVFASTETTSQASTTLSEAEVVAYPANPAQCLGTMKINCDKILFGINKDSEMNLDDCSHKCDRDANHVQFTHNGANDNYYSSYDARDNEGNADFLGWASGIKETCEQ